MSEGATIAIVGVGLIGGSLGLALKRSGSASHVVGVSRPETIDRALASGAIDEGVSYDALGEGVDGADIVFLCTPISRILELLPVTMESVQAGCVVTDVGSTKHAICEVASAHRRPDVHFVGGHPMAGSEWRGVEAADPFLFQNAIYVLTPDVDVDESAVASLADCVGSTGARTLILDAETHDRVAAAISHLPQLMATSLVGMVGRLDAPEGLALKMAAGGFRDMTRIASSPYDMWRDICRTNAAAIRTCVSQFRESLDAITARLEADELASDFSYAQDIRAGIPSDSKGFMSPLHELRLMIEDRPGVIAEIGGLLAEAEINIKDIEVMKVREGEGGSIRLGFGSSDDVELAARLLEERGLTVLAR